MHHNQILKNILTGANFHIGLNMSFSLLSSCSELSKLCMLLLGIVALIESISIQECSKSCYMVGHYTDTDDRVICRSQERELLEKKKNLNREKPKL